MAGDWMKVEKVTPDKPEIDAIASKLALDPDAVFGKCFRIWRWFDDHTVKGNAPRVTKNSIDRRVGVEGFADAMAEEKWLVIDGDGVTLPNFDRHCGETSKQRALTAKRVAKQKADANAKGNAKVTHEALPREEKRREEPSPSSPPPGSFWKEAEEALMKAGVSMAKQACVAAMDGGCTSDHVLDVVGYFNLHPGKWKPGALYHRVTLMRPGQDLADHWPEPTAEFVARMKREHSKNSHIAATTQRVNGEQQREKEQAARESREREFGAKLDAMTREQIATIIQENFSESAPLVISRLPKSGPVKGAVRDELLIHLEVEAGR